MEKYLWMSSAAVMTGPLRVKIFLLLSFWVCLPVSYLNSLFLDRVAVVYLFFCFWIVQWAAYLHPFVQGLYSKLHICTHLFWDCEAIYIYLFTYLYWFVLGVWGHIYICSSGISVPICFGTMRPYTYLFKLHICTHLFWEYEAIYISVQVAYLYPFALGL